MNYQPTRLQTFLRKIHFHKCYVISNVFSNNFFFYDSFAFSTKKNRKKKKKEKNSNNTKEQRKKNYQFVLLKNISIDHSPNG